MSRHISRLASAALFLLPLLAHPAARAASSYQEKPVPAAVPFEMLTSNHMVVEAKLNGKGPYRLIFDLGAPVTLLSNRAAVATGAIPKSARRGFFLAAQSEGKVERFEMGELEAKNLPVIVMDHPAVNALGQVLGKPLDGIVGYTFWARYKTTIDYQAKQMTFLPVDFQVRDLMKDLPRQMAGPKVARTVILAPEALWGLELDEEGEGLDNPGIKVVRVRPESPAAAAGIREGDILRSIDGRWTTSIADAYTAAQKVKADRATDVVVHRNGADVTCRVTPREGI
jgi:membrane-associated protease RseP (regulator of RpoE activity)